MIHLPRACHGRTAVRFSANSSYMCCVELALDRLLCTHLGSKGVLRRGFSSFINPTALPRWWAPIRAKLLSVAATARVICVRYWSDHGLVFVCSLLLVCTIFSAIELSSIYFSSITVFHDISKQIQQRKHIGKIFARWHIAIAITSMYL